MSIQCHVTIMVFFWLSCSALVLPFLPRADLKTAVNTVFEHDLGPALDICDLLEVIKSSLGLELQEPLSRSIKLNNYIVDLLNTYLSGRQARQAQVGYNINSFGLRFGRRATTLNMDTFWEHFDRNRELPIRLLEETFCSDYP